ncbi:MAG: tetratricopeptide repeat protein [Burkholderiaceae bacterium]|jgi:predicted negative regulator of RcsB-dependent stress response|nr:tetratricopeptide repeat protein [Burkholderiaceae bacterium]
MAISLDLEEQEQLDALKHFWERWGTWISGLLMVALLVFAGWNGWQYWQNRQAAYASALYDMVENAVESGNAARTQQALTDLESKYGGTTYAAQGALLAGKALLDQGKTAEGKAALTWAAQQAATPGLRAVARLRLAAVLMGEKAYDAALQQLTWSFPPAFVALAADRRGDVLLQQGKKNDAIAEYGKAYQGLNADGDGYRHVVGAKLAALGIDPDAGAMGGNPVRSATSAASAQGAAS